MYVCLSVSQVVAIHSPSVSICVCQKSVHPLSICMCVHLSHVCPSCIYLYVCVSIHFAADRCIFIHSASVSMCVCPSIFHLSEFVCVCVCVCVCVRVHVPACVCVCVRSILFSVGIYVLGICSSILPYVNNLPSVCM